MRPPDYWRLRPIKFMICLTFTVLGGLLFGVGGLIFTFIAILVCSTEIEWS